MVWVSAVFTGIILAISLTQFYQYHKFEHKLHQQANLVRQIVIREISAADAILSAISGSASISVDIQDRQFMSIANKLIDQNNHISSISLLEVLHESELDDFTQVRINLGNERFFIKHDKQYSKNESDRFSNHHFILYKHEPLNPRNAVFIGQDFSAIEEINNAAYASAVTGKLSVLSSNNYDPAETGNIAGMKAVYFGSEEPSDATSRLRQLKGFVIVCINLNTVLSDLLLEDTVRSIDIYDKSTSRPTLLHQRSNNASSRAWHEIIRNESLPLNLLGVSMSVNLGATFSLIRLNPIYTGVATNIVLLLLLLLYLYNRLRELSLQHLRISNAAYDNVAEAIIVTDKDANIISVNKAFTKVTGYAEQDVLGEDPRLLASGKHDTKFFQDMWNDIIAHGSWTGEIWNKNKNGKYYLELVHITAIYNKDGSHVGYVSIQNDITDRKRAEEELKSSLLEKEVLLQEVHHRVKNNLSVIVGLLRLQARKMNASEGVALDALRESESRIHAMALIHETLYGERNFSEVSFKAYLINLAGDLLASYKYGENDVKLDINVSDIKIDINSAVPCALIINELFSNALKHAFPDNRKGIISIVLKTGESDGSFTLEFSDNGVGLPAELDIDSVDSMGLSLVNILAKQLKGELTIKHHPGASFHINFYAICEDNNDD